MRVLDVTAGYRGIWFNKKDPVAVFTDIRPEVKPDYIMDLREDCSHIFDPETFDLIIFDPPHTTWGPRSQVGKRYGVFHASEIRDIIQKGAIQIHRILKDDGFLVFKWNTHEMSLEKILALMPQFRPLFGQKTATRTKHASSTYWVVLIKNRVSDV
jgi:hypothetical protein